MLMCFMFLPLTTHLTFIPFYMLCVLKYRNTFIISLITKLFDAFFSLLSDIFKSTIFYVIKCNASSEHLRKLLAQVLWVDVWKKCKKYSRRRRQHRYNTTWMGILKSEQKLYKKFSFLKQFFEMIVNIKLTFQRRIRKVNRLTMHWLTATAAGSSEIEMYMGIIVLVGMRYMST